MTNSPKMKSRRAVGMELARAHQTGIGHVLTTEQRAELSGIIQALAWVRDGRYAMAPVKAALVGTHLCVKNGRVVKRPKQRKAHD